MTYEEWLVDKEEWTTYYCLAENKHAYFHKGYKDSKGNYYITFCHPDDWSKIIGYRQLEINNGVGYVDILF